ncbi:hypothetical protein [Clostridium sp. OS1-26]|uniref:hypothetical protein n=1 Tax=Clostridium sp. OS1-26 TaxID=3070681 RepID=UPI0027E0DBD4|nr:hypothetical protein [Clostridium sp. OS1-26]WML34330.1 hypothetical protein RCG18_24045 [Clostridium sp. OS1-26]
MIVTDILFYKIYKQSVCVDDYINWAYSMLGNNIESEEICIISSFTKSDNIFEVEEYFHKALKNLEVEEPSFDSCSRSYIKHLSEKILNNNEEIFDLAYDIYHIVASLDYPEELMEWYEISEMIDSINYNTFYNEYFTRSDVEEKIIQQAKLQIESLSG